MQKKKKKKKNNVQRYRRWCAKRRNKLPFADHRDNKLSQKSEKCSPWSLCLKVSTVLDDTTQSDSEFRTLVIRLGNEWPSRTNEIWDLSNFLELPLVCLVEEKVKREATQLSVRVIVNNFVALQLYHSARHLWLPWRGDRLHKVQAEECLWFSWISVLFRRLIVCVCLVRVLFHTSTARCIACLCWKCR